MTKFTWRGLEFKARVPGDGHVLICDNWKLEFRRPNDDEWTCFAAWGTQMSHYAATYTGRQSHRTIATQALEELRTLMEVGFEEVKARMREMSDALGELEDLEEEQQTS